MKPPRRANCRGHGATARRSIVAQVTWTPRDEARFWVKVDRSGPVPPHVPELGNCWVWVSGVWRSGYGRFDLSGSSRRAHIVAWTFTHGPPSDGLEVCHACDNKLCVRPSHLWVGTHAENMADMVAKGRSPRMQGEAHHQAKLTEADVREMRRLRAERVTYRDLAERFGVSQSMIGQIVQGRAWTHVR